MGKTAKGAVWLNADRMPHYEYYQFWRDLADDDVERFLKLFTELPLGEIVALTRGSANVNEAKKTLAFEATRLAHGAAAANDAAETARRVFELGEAAPGLPSHYIPFEDLAKGIPAFRIFFDSGITSSSTEARKLIRQGGGRINNEVIHTETRQITTSDIKDGVIKVSAGAKRHILIIPSGTSAEAKAGTVTVIVETPTKFTTNEDDEKK